MNINEFNKIKAINIDAEIRGTIPNSGTFKEILDNVMSEVIIPIVNDAGTIIGMSFNTNTDNIIKDCIEQRKFQIRYSGKNVMGWVLKSLMLKADGKRISEVIENDEGIKVITDLGEIIDIEAAYQPRSRAAAEELPSEVEIAKEDLRTDIPMLMAVKDYLRNTYNHYLSGFAEDPTIEEREDIVYVTNIRWGRKR